MSALAEFDLPRVHEEHGETCPVDLSLFRLHKGADILVDPNSPVTDESEKPLLFMDSHGGGVSQAVREYMHDDGSKRIFRLAQTFYNIDDKIVRDSSLYVTVIDHDESGTVVDGDTFKLMDHPLSTAAYYRPGFDMGRTDEPVYHPFIDNHVKRIVMARMLEEGSPGDPSTFNSLYIAYVRDLPVDKYVASSTCEPVNLNPTGLQKSTVVFQAQAAL